MKTVSLSKKLLMIVLGVSSLATSITSVVQLFFEYRTERETQNAEIVLFESTTVKSLAELVWTINSDSLANLVTSTLTSPNFTRLAVTDDTGNTLFDKDETAPFKFLENRIYELKNPGDTSQKIGEARLTITNDFIYDRLKTRAMAIVATNFLKTIVVSIVLLFFFNMHAVTPIRSIASQLMRNEWDDPKLIEIPEKPWPFKIQNDEISEMVTRLNKSIGIIRRHNEMVQNQIAVTESKFYETSEQLESTQNLAKASARLAELGIFASGVAHEVNNPLTVILGAAMLLEKAATANRFEKEMYLRNLKNIQKSSDRIKIIVQGLRTFSRDGESDQFEPCSLNQLFSEIESMMKALGRVSNVTFEFFVDPDTYILGRYVQLSQVLINLINNAQDAIEDREEKWVRVRATKNDAANQVTLTVTDSGNGIPKEIREKMFAPFFTTKDVGKGTGLGLSIVHGIIKAHNGKIYINESSKNTEFVMEFPQYKMLNQSDGGQERVA
jgi:signal transduction histidine kinase